MSNAEPTICHALSFALCLCSAQVLARDVPPFDLDVSAIDPHNNTIGNGLIGLDEATGDCAARKG